MLNVDYSKCLSVVQHTTQSGTLCVSPLRETYSIRWIEVRQNLAPLVAALIRQGAISLTSQSDPFDCFPAAFIAAVHSTSFCKFFKHCSLRRPIFSDTVYQKSTSSLQSRTLKIYSLSVCFHWFHQILKIALVIFSSKRKKRSILLFIYPCFKNFPIPFAVYTSLLLRLILRAIRTLSKSITILIRS